MNFVNPLYLFGLFFISIPVIIHLFNLRRFKKVYFSNVTMLRELKQETQKKSRLRHLLILLARILAIASLVMAFAQPYIPKAGTSAGFKGNNVSVYVDNSFSMDAVSGKGTLFKDALNKALDIAAAYKTTDLFQILTTAFEGKHQAFYSKEEFISLVNELKISSSTRKLSDVISRQADLLANSGNKKKVIYILSDFQKSVSNFSDIDVDTNITIYLIPLKATKSDNVSVDSCWFSSPVMQTGHTNKLSVLVKNNSDADVEKIPVRLIVNDVQKAIASIDIPANSQSVVDLSFTSSEKGIQNARVEIVDFPVTFDDSYYFSFSLMAKIPVLCISGTKENNYIKALFSEDSAITYTYQNEKMLDYALLKKNNFVILNDVKSISGGMSNELSTFVKNGGSLLVVPPENCDIKSYLSFLTSLKSPSFSKKDTVNTRVDKINYDHHIYREVFEKTSENMDMPKVFSHYSFTANNNGKEEYLIRLLNGDVFLMSSPSGKGTVYISSVPFMDEWSNFPKHALFVPTLFNMALYSTDGTKLFYTIGKDEAVEVNNATLSDDATFSIKANKSNFEIIPEHKNTGSQYLIFPHDQITESGNYILRSGKKDISGLSYNYDRTESDLKCYSISEMETIIQEKGLKNFQVLDVTDKPVSKLLEELNQGIKLWKLFIILALLFLAVEVFLLRIK
jgi:hypothetical protein